MKRIAIFMCVVFSVLSASAQSVEPVTSVAKSGNGFVATLATGRTVKVPNPYLYKRMRQAPSEYYFATHNATETFVEKGKVAHEIYVVDSIGYDEVNDQAEVFVSNETIKAKYPSSNEEWLKVQVGQKVEHWCIDGETFLIERWHTVPREVPLTTEVPGISASQTVTTQAVTTTQTVATQTVAVTGTGTTPKSLTHRFVKH